MKNDEIRLANRKALPKFIFAMAIMSAIGGVTGYLCAKYGSDNFTEGMKKAGKFFGTNVAPWLMPALAVAIPIACTPICLSAKKLIDTWDGENDNISDTIDRKLSSANRIASTALIISYFLIAAIYSGGPDIFKSKKATVMFFVSLASLVAIIIEMLVIGQKCVDSAKRMDSEKKPSFYDIKFQKKWIENCDEAQKIMIGKCAFKAYSATNKLCAVLAGAFAMGALVFDIGFLPSFAVCLIWIINQSVYCKEAIRYHKAGNKVL